LVNLAKQFSCNRSRRGDYLHYNILVAQSNRGFITSAWINCSDNPSLLLHVPSLSENARFLTKSSGQKWSWRSLMGHTCCWFHPRSCTSESKTRCSVSVSDSSQKLDALNLVYGPTTFFARLSLILFYSRISKVGWAKKLIIFLQLSQTLFFLVDLAVASSAHALCVSVVSLQDRLCNTISNVVIAQSAASLAMDLLVLFIPSKIVWHLVMKRSQKLLLIALFSTESLWVGPTDRIHRTYSTLASACGVSFGRLVVFSRNANSLDVFWVTGLTTTLRFGIRSKFRRQNTKPAQCPRSQYRHRLRFSTNDAETLPPSRRIFQKSVDKSG